MVSYLIVPIVPRQIVPGTVCGTAHTYRTASSADVVRLLSASDLAASALASSLPLGVNSRNIRRPLVASLCLTSLLPSRVTLDLYGSPSFNFQPRCLASSPSDESGC